jgi:aspartyl protease family protein
MRRFILVLLAFAAGFGLEAVSSAEAPGISLMAVTELKANKTGHFVTSADINGSAVQVLVDTGATVVALSYEDAADIGLHPGSLDFNVPVSTANGVAQAARVKIDLISIDGIEVEDVEGLVLPEGALQGTLLGMSFLSRLGSFKVEDGILYLKN